MTREEAIKLSKKLLKNAEIQITNCKKSRKSYNIHVKIKKLCEFVLSQENNKECTERLTDNRLAFFDNFKQYAKKERKELQNIASATDLKQIYNRLIEYEDTGLSPKEIEERIGVHNVAIEALKQPERVYAHWVEYERAHYFKCSRCKLPVPYKKAMLHNGARKYNFCPNCGAIMNKRSDKE